MTAKIAKLNCKKIYVTDDNPRNEKPEKIRKEIDGLKVEYDPQKIDRETLLKFIDEL